MESKQLYSHNELLDVTFGKPGTPEREQYDMSIELWLVGRKIKEVRESKNLTQEDLGKIIGVQKAQISKIENGKNLTIATVSKVFKALDMKAKLYVEGTDLELSLS